MFSRLFPLLFALSFVSCDPAALEAALGTLSQSGGLSQETIGKGLKQALDIGIKQGAATLSAENGFVESPYKILLPPEARKVTDKLQGVPGFSNLEAKIIEKVNEGASDAAKKAYPIFRDAITQMTFTDALNILKGDKNAATQFLRRATFDRLYQEFNPVIVQSLDKFGARKIYGDAVNTYNTLPFNGGNTVNNDLDDYVTRQALDGLFGMVAKKELDIRQNVQARTTELLRQVFAQQD